MDLNKIDLLSLQTSYMQKDNFVQALCKALNPVFQKLSDSTRLVFIYGRIDELEEEAIDSLAWQFHVDFYDYSLSLNQKRELVKKAIRWHKIKGTSQSVIETVTSLFSNTTLQEWFEYNGNTFCFKVYIDVIQEILTEENLKKVYELIYKYKNKRSWLEALIITLHAYNESKVYLGCTLLNKTHYILTSDTNINYINTFKNKIGSTSLNKSGYTLTSDINTNYNKKSNNNVGSTALNKIEYELTMDMNQKNEIKSNVKNVGKDIVKMQYRLS